MYKTPPPPSNLFNLLTPPYTTGNTYIYANANVWGVTETSINSLGEETGILFDNKTNPPDRGVNTIDIGLIN